MRRWAIPLSRPLATSRGTITHRRGLAVLLHADGGLRGVGEATPHPAAPAGALAATEAAVRAAAPWLVGAALDRVDALIAQAAKVDDDAAACGLDMALHDLAARARGLPLAALLGASPRPAVAVSALLAGAEDVAVAAREAQARGYAHAKLKVGRDVREAATRVAGVAAAAPGLRLRLDPNAAWDVAGATALARAVASHPVDWIEQPVHDVAALAAVRRDGGVRLAADESVSGPEAVARLAAARAADVVVLKLVQTRGLAVARATAAAARARGLDVTVTTSLDTSLATAAALHLAAALADEPLPCGLATVELLAGDVVTRPLVSAPRMAPPPGPGLGVEVDDAALIRWQA